MTVVVDDVTPHHGVLANEIDVALFELANVFAVDGTSYLLADHITFSIASMSGFETFGVDNITFAAAVPLPATLTLMALALAGLGFQRRKAA